MSFDLARELLPGLPAYPGGRMSDEVYDAGVGRHGWFMDGAAFTHTFTDRLSDWMAHLPRVLEGCGYAPSAPYGDGEFGPVTFSNGQASYVAQLRDKTFSLRQTSGVYPADADAPCLLRDVTDTDAAHFQAYVSALEALGWRRAWENTLGANLFCALENGERRVYASCFPGEGTARFVEDNLSAPIETFGGGEAVPGGTVEVCQFGLYYSYMRLGRSCDCGMLYIIKLPDNSLFLVDGGEREQATEAACEAVIQLMHQMSGTQPGQRMRIAGWFCTHAHDDHLDLFAKLLRKYHGEMDVERLIFNFPACSSWLLAPQVSILKERLHRYCPNARYLKCHTGQQFTLAGVRFEILFTHEDHVARSGREALPPQLREFNDTCTVLKVSYEGASFLVLGDVDQPSSRQLLCHYGPDVLHCTAMQAAHHLINNLPELYAAIAPDMALVPASVCFALDTRPEYTTLCQAVPPQHCYFAGAATDIFRVEAGRFRLVRRCPIEGYIYDGSMT